MQIKAIALFAAGAAAIALPEEVMEKRYPPGYCHRDNCFRNLLYDKYVSSATGFCATWLRTTSTQTDYAVFTTSETTTSTPEVVTNTEDATVTATVTTGTETITTYYTIPDYRYRKRDDTSDYPSWLSTSCNLARVTSACSCFLKEKSVAPLTVYETVTVTTATEVISYTETLPTETETVTETETATDEVTYSTTLPIGLKCGLKGCPDINQIDDVKYNVPNTAACKAHCISKSWCKAYTYSSALNTCSIANVDAETLYFGTSICPFSKTYDRKC